MRALLAAAGAIAPASLPPRGLHGLDPSFSRLVTAGPGAHTWHLLDNADHLDRLGVEPVGTLLCVHGNPTWSYLWRRLVAEAADRAAAGGEAWRVVAVDQLDMGFSERTGSPRGLPQRVADLGDLTTALGLAGPVVTVGHDWGGVISLGWAVDHPDLLAGVVLLNTAVHQPAHLRVPVPLRLALRPAVLGSATVATPAFLETTLALARPRLPRPVRDAYRAPYREAARRGGIGGFVADIPVTAAHPSAAELDRVAAGVRALDVPALLLWGPGDPVFGDQYLDDLVDRLPHAAVHRFEGAGHLVAEDVDYATAALDWLASATTGPGAPAADAPPPDAPAEYDVPGTRSADTPAPPYEPPRYEPLWHHLDAQRDSTRTALVEMAPTGGAGPRVVTWALLARRVRELAAGLTAVGVRPGDRVSLLVPPGADLTAVLYACLRIGAVVVVADAGLGVRGLTRAVRGARPDHVVGELPGLTVARALGWPGRRISTTPLLPAVARALGVGHALVDLVDAGRGVELPAEPSPDATAAVLFTSGSTGPAKGVVYTHRQLAAVAGALRAQYDLGAGTGLVAGFAPFALLAPALGARSVTPDMDVTSPRTLTAPAVAAAAAAVDATVLFLSPAALANVVATAGDLTPADHAALARVRTFLSAGAPVPEHLLAAAGRLMPNAEPHTPYGMTEGLLMTDATLAGIREATAARADGDPGGVCVGRPTATTQVRISPLGDDGAATGEPTTEAGRTGEILVSAPHLKDGYFRLHLTDRAAARDVPGRRWHRTGDVGHLDGEGRLWVEGRLAHVVTTADGVVTPVGLEQRVERVPAVDRAGVVGIGPRGTQLLVAVVETRPRTRRPGLAPAELAGAVRAAVPAPLAAVLVVPGLPTDVRHNSKIDRTRLARWAEDVLSGGRVRRP
ncbi:alpha/beta fold hydrolase [Cellulomonas shaoxiangyii]|uniref:Alpha/beta fold hydrolase n=1 Tax=Cellulomonas shaoxiangyii TaxID=2566013 RepID=A0A4P7SLT5_9CELL|nr:alpha/beta fold hydrolase [Cellulomonas shaoxiangyii]QCB94497.1 alpha/beta fold hydrolase [Cellulomonas shaoxiangyii]TGY86079.1 alpha/beta fold hydrolase [Cellulomonas shaoxiangyii]